MPPPPLEGGEGRRHIAGKWGAGGRGGGIASGAFCPQDDGDPPSGGQGWAGGRRKDAVGHKDRTEGWRTGMVWESGDGLEV